MYQSKYLAFVLDTASRDRLMVAFPVVYDAICHHVTIEFNNLTQEIVEHFMTMDRPDVRVIFHCHDDNGLECFGVAINGRTLRPDGNSFHITHSKAKHRKARESVELVDSHYHVGTGFMNVLVSGSFMLLDK